MPRHLFVSFGDYLMSHVALNKSNMYPQGSLIFVKIFVNLIYFEIENKIYKLLK